MSNSIAPMTLGEYALSTFDLDAAIERLINQHGADAVREAAARLTKKKRGRRQEHDWPILGPQISRLDAIDWIEGRNPFELRSNYSIAAEFVKKHPGHSPTATSRRIMRKLADHRSYYFTVAALEICERERPFADYFRVFAIAEFQDERIQQAFQLMHNLHLGNLQDYRNRFGEPDPNMTPDAIRTAVRDVSFLSIQPKKKRGLFGSARPGGLLAKFAATTGGDK